MKIGIKSLIIRDSCLLLIFYTTKNLYQYEIWFENNATCISRQIYCTEVEAYEEGLKMIKLVRRCQ